MDDRYPRRYGAAQFEQLQLRGAIDRQVVLRRIHRIEMTGLRRQVEQEILAGQQKAQRLAVADIGDVDPHPVADIGDIGEIAARLRHHAVDQHHFGAERDETARQSRADQADAAGDQHAGIAKRSKARIRTATHNPSLVQESSARLSPFPTSC